MSAPTPLQDAEPGALAPRGNPLGNTTTGTPTLPSEGLRLGVAAVAHRIGVAPATLRTWDRRYGVGPSAHAAGSHRRYTPLDVLRLELMQRALAQGVGPAEAARVALAATEQQNLASTGGALTSLPAPSDHVRPLTGRRRPHLKLGDAGPKASRLADTVLDLDMDATVRVLQDSVHADGIITTWDHVARPVLRAAAELWLRTGDGIEVEHLLTEALTTVMGRVNANAQPPQSSRPVLLGALTGEHHALPMRVLTATLIEGGVRANLLGTDLPVAAMSAAVTRTTPAAVFLWSQHHHSANTDLVARLPRRRPHTRCYVGGPGWDTTALPPTVVLLSSLSEARNVLTAAAGL